MMLWTAALFAWNSPAMNVGSSMNSTSVSPRLRMTENATISGCSFSAGMCFSSHWSNLLGLASSSSGK